MPDHEQRLAAVRRLDRLGGSIRLKRGPLPADLADARRAGLVLCQRHKIEVITCMLSDKGRALAAQDKETDR